MGQRPRFVSIENLTSNAQSWVWLVHIELQHWGTRRQEDSWGFLATSLAPSSVSDPNSKKYDYIASLRQPESREVPCQNKHANKPPYPTNGRTSTAFLRSRP